MSTPQELNLSQKCLAEALGTAFLLAAIVGSGIMAERLAGGSDALALLCNALVTGAALTVLIVIFAPLSGAHFNPAVSLALRIEGAISDKTFVAFVAVQIVAGLLGVLAAHAMFDQDLLQFSTHARTGASQWFAEGIATFGLVLTILLLRRSQPSAIPVAVGLYIMSAIWFTSSTSFANPAVTIGRAFSDTFTGIRLLDVPAFVSVQFAGAVVAFLIAKRLRLAVP